MSTTTDIKQQSKGGYRRPKRKRGKFLDYGKVDWQALQDELDATTYGQKKWVIYHWGKRLKCSRDTLYLGLRKWKRGDV